MFNKSVQDWSARRTREDNAIFNFTTPPALHQFSTSSSSVLPADERQDTLERRMLNRWTEDSAELSLSPC